MLVAVAVLVFAKGTGCAWGETPVQAPARQPSAAAVTEQQAPGIIVPTPDDEKRVTAGAAFTPGTAAAGTVIVLFVRVRVAPDHWIYALGESGSTMVPTTLTVSNGVLRPAGSWRGPEPKVKDGSRTLSGDVLFERSFLVETASAPGDLQVPITVKYQVCNESACWPPATIPLQATLTLVNK